MAEPTTSPMMDRRLRGPEDFFHVVHKNFGFLLTASVKIESDSSIDVDYIRKGFALLSDRHPVLRLKITSDTSGAAGKYFFSQIEDFVADVTLLDIPSESWADVFEDMLHQTFDTENGPLWKVRILNEIKIAEGYSRQLVMSFHHAIVDGKSIATLCYEVLKHIRSLQDGCTPHLEPHPFMPSLEERLGDRVKNNWMTKKVVSVVVNSYIIKLIKGDSDNFYLKAFPPVVESDASVEHKSKIMPFKLDEVTTFRLITLCKTYGVSIEGFLSAVLARALSSLLAKDSDGNDPTTTVIPSGYIMDMRQRIKDQNPNTCCGCYVSRLPCSIEVKNQKGTETFWQTAKESSRQIEKCITDEQDIENYKMMNLIGGKKEEIIKGQIKTSRAGRLGSNIFNASFSGQHSQPENEKLRIREFYMAASEHQIGPVFANNAIIVDGQLCCTITFFTHITDKSTSILLHQKILDEIHTASH